MTCLMGFLMGLLDQRLSRRHCTQTFQCYIHFCTDFQITEFWLLWSLIRCNRYSLFCICVSNSIEHSTNFVLQYFRLFTFCRNSGHFFFSSQTFLFIHCMPCTLLILSGAEFYKERQSLDSLLV